MPLSSTNVKAEAEKIQLAKLKGINLSQLFRDALDSSLKVTGDGKDMLESQLAEIRKQIEILHLEEKLVLSQLQTMESKDEVNQHREAKFNKWKKNIAYMIKHNTIDWNTQKDLFKFKDIDECKKWILSMLKNEGLI